MSVIETAQRNKEGQKKPTRYYSNKQEKKVADTYKGFQTKNSGATKFGGKGDVLIPGLMSIECKTKTTLSDSISLDISAKTNPNILLITNFFCSTVYKNKP